MTNQNAINAVPALKLVYTDTAVAGTTVSLQTSIVAPAFLVVAENIEVTSPGRRFHIRVSDDGGATYNSNLTTSANYLANAAATVFTNLSATTASLIQTGPDLDDAGGLAFVQCNMLNWRSRMQWVGQFSQSFAGSPDTFVSGLLQGGLDAGITFVQLNYIQFILDDATTTWGGTISIYEYVG